MHSTDPASRVLYICSDASNNQPTWGCERVAQGHLCNPHRNAVPKAQRPKTGGGGVQETIPHLCHQ